jgi:hypothetical protein
MNRGHGIGIAALYSGSTAAGYTLGIRLRAIVVAGLDRHASHRLSHR